MPRPVTTKQRDRLIRAAKTVRKRAYAKYSKFRVGAAVLTKSGEVFAGCNVENASYGLTLCAERAAVANAVAAGQRRFRAMALVLSGGGAPCGACRQFLGEFCDDLPIFILDVDAPGNVRKVSLNKLLPARFDLTGKGR